MDKSVQAKIHKKKIDKPSISVEGFDDKVKQVNGNLTDSKSVTITVIDPEWQMHQVLSEAHQEDDQTTYLVIPDTMGQPHFSVDSIQGVQVGFVGNTPAGVGSPPDNVYYAIEAAGDPSYNVINDISSNDIKTIECFDDNVMITHCSGTDNSTIEALKINYNDTSSKLDYRLLKTDIHIENSVSSCKSDNYVEVLCIVCNKNVSEDVKSVALETAKTSSTGKPAALVLTTVVGDVLSFVESQEEMLCSPCFKVLELLDFLEHKLQRTTASLVSQYWQTAKLRKHCGSKNTGNSTSKSWSMCRAKRRKELCISNEVYPHQTSVTTSPVSQSEYPLSPSRERYSIATPAADTCATSLCSTTTSRTLSSAGCSNAEAPFTAEGTEVSCSIKDSAPNLAPQGDECTADGAPPLLRKRGRPKKNKQREWCVHCNKWIRGRYYGVHLNTHTHNVTFPCAGCTLVFYTRSSLQSHCKRNHDDTKKFFCQECGKSFIYHREMMLHINTVHKNLRKFTCQICKMSFKMVAHLNYHMRTHTGEKPNSCNICKSSFKRPGELKNHMSKVHDIQYLGKYRERLKELRDDDLMIVDNFVDDIADDITVRTEQSCHYTGKDGVQYLVAEGADGWHHSYEHDNVVVLHDKECVFVVDNLM